MPGPVPGQGTPAKPLPPKPETPQRERRGSFAGLFTPGGIFFPPAGRTSSTDDNDSVPIEAIPGVEAICVQLQRMDQEYRGLLADIEEHSMSEIHAARQLAKAAQALASVAVANGESEDAWGAWSSVGSTLLATSTLNVALYKTRTSAPANEVRQSHLWEEGGALWTPAVALATVIKDMVDGVLGRALVARAHYRDTLAEASLQVVSAQIIADVRARKYLHAYTGPYMLVCVVKEGSCRARADVASAERSRYAGTIISGEQGGITPACERRACPSQESPAQTRYGS